MHQIRIVPALFAVAVLIVAACAERAQPSAPTQTVVEPRPAQAAVAETSPVPAGSAAINFQGFGPAKFGDSEEAVRMSWGYPLQAGKPAAGSSCYQLGMDPTSSDGAGIVFMMEDGHFVRYDVDVQQHVAPGGGLVGDSADKILSIYTGHVEQQPHKYIPGGRNLIVTPTDAVPARLIFEVDDKGVVTRWRIGVPPQIFYVEGCG